MRIKKEIVKVLSMSFLLTTLPVTFPTTITHAAGPYGGGSENEIDNKRDEEDKKKKEEEEKRKEEEKIKVYKEELKEIAKRVVQIDVKEENVVRREETEKLVKDLPSEILEMYDKVGGKIKIVDGSLAEYPDLKGRKAINDNGKEVSLDQYYAYSIKGKAPEVFIRASEDYEENIDKRKIVYTEIGKSMVQDVLKSEVLMDSSFLQAVNQMRLDKDTEAEFFSQNLRTYKGTFDETYVKEHIKDFQDIFAKAFAYSRIPEFEEFFNTYAPGMFDYFDKLDWGKLKDQVQEKEQVKNEALDFAKDGKAALQWAKENLKGYAEKLNAAEKAEIDFYTTSNYSTINSYLRDSEGSKYQDKEGLKKRIDLISSGLQKLSLPTDIVVYRRTGTDTFKPDPNNPILKFDFNNPKDIESFKKQYEGSLNEEKAFLSTSLVRDPDLYGSFMQKRILMRITLPKGTHAGFLPALELGTYQGENEMLLDHGYQYKIDKIGTVETELSTGKRRTDVFVEATVLPEN
ncbi:ADP-ribosyltransferase [Bacillus mycoides]|uniref:ADP-ribosyltransferase n=1 Tax=Bacillus mycoides TaxID=1405 RepID=UPI003D1ACC40